MQMVDDYRKKIQGTESQSTEPGNMEAEVQKGKFIKVYKRKKVKERETLICRALTPWTTTIYYYYYFYYLQIFPKVYNMLQF